MNRRNREYRHVDGFETPANSATAESDREEGTLLRTGRRNEESNLNLDTQERLGADVLTMHRKGCNLVLGTWNVRTLYAIGKLENTLMEMKNHKIDIMGIAEMRWTESGSIKKDDYLVLYSGGEKHTEGVGVIINKKYSRAVMGFLPYQTGFW